MAKAMSIYSAKIDSIYLKEIDQGKPQTNNVGGDLKLLK